jgi:DNA ligase-1
MPDLEDGQQTEMQGSGSQPYILKNTGGVYSCSCPAWRNQSIAIEVRTCKHLRKFRGDAAEEARVGAALPQKPERKNVPAEGATDESEAAAPPLLLAESWDNSTDLTGWWMSEKLDGVRAYWDGRQFISRLGNLYHAPDWFVEGLPQFPLDGELWIDRKKFQRTVSIVRRQDKSDQWKEVKFLIFDAPNAPGVFEERIRFLKSEMADGTAKFAMLLAHEKCTGLEALRAELARVEALGGEGLMLRQPGSKYFAGRSSTLLKIKSFLDAEAVVTGYQAGEGRHKGRMGALRVQMANGTSFSIGTGFSDFERENPPPIGSTVTFRYQELSDGGVPRFPSWVGVRTDVVVKPTTIQATSAVAPEKAVVKPVKLEVAQVASAASTSPRYFELVEGTSSKFWEVSQAGDSMTTRWGRIGTNGQSKTKTFPDAQSASTAISTLIRDKTKEGYVEKTGA